MTTTTQKTVAKAKRLTKKLLALDGGFYWQEYVVDGMKFETMRDAEVHARKLATLKGEGVWINKVKIPCNLPQKGVYALNGGGDCVEQKMRHSIRLYFVGDQPFLDLKEAREFAIAEAIATHEHQLIVETVVKPQDMVFKQWVHGDELDAKVTEQEAA